MNFQASHKIVGPTKKKLENVFIYVLSESTNTPYSSEADRGSLKLDRMIFASFEQASRHSSIAFTKKKSTLASYALLSNQRYKLLMNSYALLSGTRDRASTAPVSIHTEPHSLPH